MDETSNLGLFSKLPYELREQIWLEFLPCGRDKTSVLKSSISPKTHLEILRTSRDLYYEISNCLYSNVCLQFDLSSFYFQDAFLWTTLHFNKINRRGEGHIETKATCKFLSRKRAKRRGFYNLRLHPQITIEVNLLAPDPDDPGQLFWLWRKIMRLVEMLEEASELSRLTIRLQKCEAQDWHRSIVINSSITDPYDKKYDHNVVICPFYRLQNTKAFSIETHSDELKRVMNWDMINWAGEIISKRDAKSPPITFRERDIDRRIANDYFWIYQNLFSTCEGKTADFVRRVWLSNWFIKDEDEDGCNIHSEFEEKIIDIIDNYPEIIYRYDRNLETLTYMHRAMVVLNHHAMFMQGEFPNWNLPEWQRWVWFKEYNWGIPNRASPDYGYVIGIFLKYVDVYFKYARYGGFFSRIPRVIEQWQSHHSAS